MATELRIEGLKTALVGPVDLAVTAGECVAISGPSGAGKSLFLRAVVDLDPNDGEVFLDDRPRSGFSAPAWRRAVALVPAESGWWADRVDTHFAGDKPDPALLSALGLPDDAGSWEVARLSTGERHRLAIARALALSPRVLLLDEPTAALDPAATEAVEKLIRKLLDDGVSVLLVTHAEEQADRLGARKLTLRDGRLADPGGAP